MTKADRRKLLHGCVIVALLLAPCSLFAGILVVTSVDSPAINLSKDQVSDLFQGRVLALPDGRSARPVDQPESDPLRDEFYQKVANKSAAQIKAQWAKLYFTGRGVPPIEGKSSDDVKRIVNSTPNAIGYIDQSALDSSVRVIYVVQ